MYAMPMCFYTQSRHGFLSYSTFWKNVGNRALTFDITGYDTYGYCRIWRFIFTRLYLLSSHGYFCMILSS